MATLKTPEGNYRYSPVLLYEGRKEMDKEVAIRNLKELAELLSAAGIQSGPAFGSLLGIVRDHDFIAWDEDIDMYILQEQETAFRSLLWKMRENGFELVRYDWRGLYSVMRDGEYIDFYVFRSVSPELRNNGGPTFIFEKYFRDTVRVNFKGVSLTIPSDSEELLSFLYGDSWRTPVRYYSSSPGPLSIFRKRLVRDCKSLVPSFLRPWIIRLLRRKDLHRFVLKCEGKGISLQYPVTL